MNAWDESGPLALVRGGEGQGEGANASQRLLMFCVLPRRPPHPAFGHLLPQRGGEGTAISAVQEHPPVHPALLPDEELLQQCEVRTARRRGPGGQHRNKTESAVVIKHLATGIEGQAAERRSQVDNHRNALKRLRRNLAIDVRDSSLLEHVPTELWRKRCRDGRMVINPEHADFTPLLAEALELVYDHMGNVHSAAERLGCTFSQLVKFLKHEPRAWQRVGALRNERGLPELT